MLGYIFIYVVDSKSLHVHLQFSYKLVCIIIYFIAGRYELHVVILAINNDLFILDPSVNCIRITVLPK